MEAKAAKGLLNEQELEALRQAQQNKKDDCVIM